GAVILSAGKGSKPLGTPRSCDARTVWPNRNSARRGTQRNSRCGRRVAAIFFAAAWPNEIKDCCPEPASPSSSATLDVQSRKSPSTWRPSFLLHDGKDVPPP